MSFRRLENVPAWRAMAVHAWDAPRDPTVYGVIDVDATNSLAFIEKLRAETGAKITLTHLVGKAAAVAIAARPEVNAIIRRGRIYVRDSVDIFFQVAFDGGENLAGAKVSPRRARRPAASPRTTPRRRPPGEWLGSRRSWSRSPCSSGSV